MMAAEYRITLPDETLLAAELDRTRQAIELRGSATSGTLTTAGAVRTIGKRLRLKLGDDANNPARSSTSPASATAWRGVSKHHRSRPRLPKPLSSYPNRERDTTPHPDLAVVTGAFSYTGRYVTRRLLDQGRPRQDTDPQPGCGGPLRRPSGGGPLGLFRSRWAVPLDAGSGRLLQHLLGTVRPWPDHLRPPRSRTPRCCLRLQRGRAAAG